MKLSINKNYLYLFLVYLSLGLLVRFIFNEQILAGSIWQPIVYAGFLMVIVVSFEPLLKVIQQVTGDYYKEDIDLFSKVLDLNKKIQNLLDIDKVLKLVEVELYDLLKSEEIIFYIDSSIETKDLLINIENIGSNNKNHLRLWRNKRKELEAEIDDDLVEEIIKINRIFTSNESNSISKSIFIKSNTNIAVPVIHGRQLLCLILITQFKKSVSYSEKQIEVLEYLSNQLALFLDRIKIYQKVMLQTAMENAEKLQVMQSICSNIAHEMRTPLSGIRASISGVEDYLPELIKAYQNSYENNPDKFSLIRKDHLNSLISTPDRITLMIDQANTVIDMLLMNLGERSLDDDQMNICSVKECIEQAVERYPFRSDERNKVKLEISGNFNFLGIESMFIYVIFNLLKNSLYSIRSAQKGNIVISLESDVKADMYSYSEKYNLICFRDTGEGADEDVINKMFNSFYTTKEGGTGAGLAYCKRTIESFKGKIECESIVGEYCEFKIYLPELKLFS